MALQYLLNFQQELDLEYEYSNEAWGIHYSLLHRRRTSITVLLDEVGQTGYNPLETHGCRQFPSIGKK